MRNLFLSLSFVLLVSSGCASSSGSRRLEAPAAPDAAFAGTRVDGRRAASAASLPAQAPEEITAAAIEAWGRKVIKTASLGVEVADRRATLSALSMHVAALGGFIISSNDGERRTYATFRVPSQHFESIVARIGEAGKVTERSISGEDVTEEYLDLAARIANSEKLRDRLLSLYEKAVQVSEMLQIEAQVSAVQERIEQMKGRLEFLKHQVALSTIRLTLRDAEPETWPGPVTIAVKGAFWLVEKLFWIPKPDLGK